MRELTHDKRYTITLEYCGYVDQKHVLRFCDDFLSCHDTLGEAQIACIVHEDQRLSLGLTDYFKIATTGDYITRNGSIVTVFEIKPKTSNHTTENNVKGSIHKMFRGKMRPKGFEIWQANGRWSPLKPSGFDIVAKA